MKASDEQIIQESGLEIPTYERAKLKGAGNTRYQSGQELN